MSYLPAVLFGALVFCVLTLVNIPNEIKEIRQCRRARPAPPEEIRR